MLTKSIVGRWNLSPLELHKHVYHGAKSELAGLITSSYASPHSRTWWVGLSAVLTTFIHIQLSLELGQRNSHLPAIYCVDTPSKSAQGHPGDLSYGLEYSSVPVQFS